MDKIILQTKNWAITIWAGSITKFIKNNEEQSVLFSIIKICKMKSKHRNKNQFILFCFFFILTYSLLFAKNNITQDKDLDRISSLIKSGKYEEIEKAWSFVFENLAQLYLEQNFNSCIQYGSEALHLLKARQILVKKEFDSSRTPNNKNNPPSYKTEVDLAPEMRNDCRLFIANSYAAKGKYEEAIELIKQQEAQYGFNHVQSLREYPIAEGMKALAETAFEYGYPEHEIYYTAWAESRRLEYLKDQERKEIKYSEETRWQRWFIYISIFIVVGGTVWYLLPDFKKSGLSPSLEIERTKIADYKDREVLHLIAVPNWLLRIPMYIFIIPMAPIGIYSVFSLYEYILEKTLDDNWFLIHLAGLFLISIVTWFIMSIAPKPGRTSNGSVTIDIKNKTIKIDGKTRKKYSQTIYDFNEIDEFIVEDSYNAFRWDLKAYIYPESEKKPGYVIPIDVLWGSAVQLKERLVIWQDAFGDKFYCDEEIALAGESYYFKKHGWKEMLKQVIPLLQKLLR